MELTKQLLINEKKTLTQLENAQTNSRMHCDKAKLLSLMANLRKAANHPYLFPGIEKVAIDGLPREEIVSSSGKLMFLDKLLPKLKIKGHRVVLFSQFTQMLDIISDYLDYRSYNHCRIDGSTNRVMREVLIALFNRDDSDLFIFCLSTKAGGEGINLTSADTVIIFDSDWNPQVDNQAMARVHRIGQKKPVHVYRLVSNETVEDRIINRAQKKLFLDSMVNRGSTALAKSYDDVEELKCQEDTNDPLIEEMEESSKLFSTLK